MAGTQLRHKYDAKHFRSKYPEKPPRAQDINRLIIEWSSLDNIDVISWLGRGALLLLSLGFWAYIIVGSIQIDIEITHLTNWSLILGLIFYTITFIGTLFPPILKYAMLLLLLPYHALLYIVAIGILIIVSYDVTIFQEAIDKYGLAKVTLITYEGYILPEVKIGKGLYNYKYEYPQPLLLFSFHRLFELRSLPHIHTRTR